MRSLRLKILILINLICFGVFGQHFDFVKITPGQGIVFNNDTIILGKTSIKDVCRIFKIKDDATAITKQDIIAENKLEYQLSSFGISLQLEKLPNDDLRLTEIAIYKK
jgi:hypothetical protein